MDETVVKAPLRGAGCTKAWSGTPTIFFLIFLAFRP
jgi:hypothetical protein